MTGDISVSDHTVLFLVCNHIAGDRTTNLVHLNKELERMKLSRSLFEIHRDRLGWKKKQGTPIKRKEPLRFKDVYSERPIRQRRTPNRLNIGSTKGSSYDNFS